MLAPGFETQLTPCTCISRHCYLAAPLQNDYNEGAVLYQGCLLGYITQ